MSGLAGLKGLDHPHDANGKRAPVTLTIELTAQVAGLIRDLTETGLYGQTTEDTAAQLLTSAVRGLAK